MHPEQTIGNSSLEFQASDVKLRVIIKDGIESLESVCHPLGSECRESTALGSSSVTWEGGGKPGGLVVWMLREDDASGVGNEQSYQMLLRVEQDDD